MENEYSHEFINARWYIENLPRIPASSSCNIIYFDLETSGFSGDADILQIAAKFGGSVFKVYVNPTRAIDYHATQATGLENINGDLYHYGERVHTVPIHHALIQFKRFLESFPTACVLVAHNARFDTGHLMRAIIHNAMINHFSMIAGFSDSYALMRMLYPDRRGPEMFTLGRLARDFLNVQPNGKFHEALYDVEILQKLVSLCIPVEQLIANCQSYKDAAMVSLMTPVLRPMRGCVSDQILRKLALAGLTPGALRRIYEVDGPGGIRAELSRPGADNAAIVTRNQVVMQNIIEFIEGH